jgi:hypothetical protein
MSRGRSSGEIHVVDRVPVLTDVVLCLRAGALLTVFEPDWDSFTVRGSAGDEPCGWICSVRHPGVGSELWSLIEKAVVAGRISQEHADGWVAEQRERDTPGIFRAAMPKILIVAQKR